MNKTICFVAGHSGGHIIPSLTKAQQLRNEHQAENILFFSTTAPLDTKIINNHPVISRLILLPVRGVPYSNKLLLPLFGLRLVQSFFVSLFYLIFNRPAKIISMGGYVSIPVCAAGWVLRIPIELYELNIEPGKAVNFLAPIARKILVMYRETILYLPADKCELTEYPVRFSQDAKNITREESLAALKLDASRKTIFVLGGSQGSVFINTLLKKWFEELTPELRARVQVIHQTGEHDRTDWQQFYEQMNIKSIIFTYDEQLIHFYQAADLVISRAGAGTLAELLFFGKKSLIIPLETPNTSHQLYNAQAFVEKNSSLFSILQQREIDGNVPRALTRISQLLGISASH